MRRVLVVAVALASVAAAGCAPGEAFESKPLAANLASPPLVTGTSLRDFWAVVDRSDAGPVVIGHVGRDQTWEPVTIRGIGGVAALAAAGFEEAWLLTTATSSGVPAVLQLRPGGVVTDHTMELPAGTVANISFASLGANGHAGGVFVSVGTPSGGSFPRARILRLVDGRLAEITNAPAAALATIIGVVGPDEAYFSLDGNGSRIVRYAAGAWSDVPWSGTMPSVKANPSTGEVWLWSGGRASSGGSGLVGDGTTFTPFTVAGWPDRAAGVPVTYTALELIPIATGRAAILARRAEGSRIELDSVAIGVDGRVTGDRRLASCASLAACSFDPEAIVLFTDGTVGLATSTMLFVGPTTAL